MLKINFPKNKYKTIYADPPWPEQGGGKIKRGADRHYPLMPVKEIIELPVGELADLKDAICIYGLPTTICQRRFNVSRREDLSI